MKTIIRDKVIGFVEKIHLLIFGHSMSAEMKIFLGNLSWSFVSGLIIMPLMLLVTTLAGRFMGPTEYGKYSLLIVISQFLIIFIFFGLDTTSVKYIVKAKSFEDRKKVISTNFNFILSVLGLLVVLASLSYPILLKFYKGYSLFVLMAVVYTLIVSIKVAFDLIIRGMENFKRQAQGKLLEAGVVVIIFCLTFFALKRTSFVDFVLVLNAGAIAISVFYLVRLAKYFGKSDKKLLLKQLGEGKIFFVSTLLVTIFISSDRLVVAKYLGIEILGIYSAYYMASFGLISQLTQFFTNVFFPASARLEDKSFAKKIDKLLFVGLVPLFLLSSCLILLVFFILGKAYPLNLWYIGGFSLFAALFFFQSLYNTVMLDSSKERYKKYFYCETGINLFTIALYAGAILLHRVSIAWVVEAQIINSLITIFVARIFIKKMQND